jgi:hypothetical protein
LIIVPGGVREQWMAGYLFGLILFGLILFGLFLFGLIGLILFQLACLCVCKRPSFAFANVREPTTHDALLRTNNATPVF